MNISRACCLSFSYVSTASFSMFYPVGPVGFMIAPQKSPETQEFPSLTKSPEFSLQGGSHFDDLPGGADRKQLWNHQGNPKNINIALMGSRSEDPSGSLWLWVTTPKILLVKGNIHQNLWFLGVFFLTQSLVNISASQELTWRGADVVRQLVREAADWAFTGGLFLWWAP